MDVVADDRAEFAPSGVDERSVYERAVVFPVVAQIPDDRPRAEVHAVAQHRIADVAQVSDGGLEADHRVFDFDRLTDVAVVADDGVAADVAVGADLAVLADHGVALDEDAGQDARPFAEAEHALDVRGCRDFARDLRRVEFGDQSLVQYEDVPRVADAHPGKLKYFAAVAARTDDFVAVAHRELRDSGELRGELRIGDALELPARAVRDPGEEPLQILLEWFVHHPEPAGVAVEWKQTRYFGADQFDHGVGPVRFISACGAPLRGCSRCICPPWILRGPRRGSASCSRCRSSGRSPARGRVHRLRG